MGLTHKITFTWAIDIILLTIIVRFLMYPLNRQMNRSLKLMQKLQPEIKEIQEKYKGKPDVAQKEIMKIYQKYKVNPFSSCWPLLLQMPIFIALFWMLRDPRFYLRLPDFGKATIFGTSLTIPPIFTHPYPESAMKAGVLDLRSVMHFPFLADKFLYLPTLWLVAVYIVTTIIQSRQMQAQSQASGGSQSNQMAFMLPMFIIFGLLFPTGLLVYFITSNILQIVQYWRIQREVALEEAITEGGVPKVPASVEVSNKITSTKKKVDPVPSRKSRTSKTKKSKK